MLDSIVLDNIVKITASKPRIVGKSNLRGKEQLFCATDIIFHDSKGKTFKITGFGSKLVTVNDPD